MSDELPLSDEEIFRALGMGARLIAIERAILELARTCEELRDAVKALSAPLAPPGPAPGAYPHVAPCVYPYVVYS